MESEGDTDVAAHLWAIMQARWVLWGTQSDRKIPFISLNGNQEQKVIKLEELQLSSPYFGSYITEIATAAW